MAPTVTRASARGIAAERPRAAHPRARGLVLFAAAAVVATGMVVAPSSAHAWNETELGPLDVTVAADSDARATVTITLGVGVIRGWLEQLELAGFDPDLALDPDRPAWAVTADGRKLDVETRVRPGGVILVDFRDGQQPRRGRLTLGLTYRTTLAHVSEPGSDRVVFRWEMPPWNQGIERATVHLLVPHSAGIAPTVPEGELEDRLVTLTRSTSFDAGRWQRVHLPRNSMWRLSLALDERVVEPSLRAPRPGAPPPRAGRAPAEAPRSQLPPRAWLLAIGIALALLPALKVLSARSDARRTRTRVNPLVPFPMVLRPLAASGLFAGGAVLSYLHFSAGIAVAAAGIALAVFLTPRARPPVRATGTWCPATRRDLRRARVRALLEHVSPLGLLDATTLPGSLAQLAILGAAAWASAVPLALAPARWAALPVLLALALAPLFWTATRRHLPPRPHHVLVALGRAARRIRFRVTARSEGDASFALGLLVHRDAHDRVTDARIVFDPGRAIEGLHRLELAVATRAARHGWETTFAVLAHVAPGHERALASIAGATVVRGSRDRIVVVVPAEVAAVPAIAHGVVQRLSSAPSASSLSANAARRHLTARSAMTTALSSP
ncbi:MAG: hypothetical protein IT379_10050 [Deltaproteobacteria bacterium]|nr:hypothetical protein [Deltaproteobacteria bacterium]